MTISDIEVIDYLIKSTGSKSVTVTDDFIQTRFSIIPRDALLYLTKCGCSYEVDGNLIRIKRGGISKDDVSILGVIQGIAKQGQAQYDLKSQLRDLRVAANRLGLYDAADFLEKHMV